jgi:site-specific recombinase XerD
MEGQVLLVPAPSERVVLPALIANAPDQAQRAFMEFFAATIPNANTRAAYMRDILRFARWCDERGFRLEHVTSIHVAAYREEVSRELSAPSVKRHFSALRMLFSFFVEKGVLDRNPVREVKTARFSRPEGKTPAFTPEEMHQLFESFDASSVVGLRDRALIGVMAFTFARVEAAVSLRVKDFMTLGRRAVIRLNEKGGKEREIPCHHTLVEYLDTYIEAAGIGDQKNLPLFRSAVGRTGKLTQRAVSRTDAYAMIQRRVEAAGLKGQFSCHSFRATGITTYLENGGTLEMAQWIAGHADSRTTKLYDRRNQRASLDDIERIRF